MNKRYWIFAFNYTDSKGGLDDFKFSFNNIDEFEEKILNVIDFTNYQILDTKTHFYIDGDIGTITKWICKNIGDERYDSNRI